MDHRATIETVRNKEPHPLVGRAERANLNVFLGAALRASFFVRVTRQFRVWVSRNLIHVNDFFAHATPFVASLVPLVS